MALENEPVDLGNDPGSGDFTPDASGAALPILATIALPVSYAPNPLTAALQITEAGMNEGAYPCAVSGPNLDGSFTLTASLTSIPAGLVPGAVSVQPGDIAAGVFVPNGAPDLGTLSIFQPPAPLLDIAWTAGPVQTDVSDPNSNRLVSGASGYLHVLITGKYNQDQSPADLSQLTPAPLSLSMALVSSLSDPAPAYQYADVLTVTAPPPLAGTYARLLISASAGNSPPPDCYFVAIRVGTDVEYSVIYAENTLRVWGEAVTNSLLSNSVGLNNSIGSSNSAGDGTAVEPGFDGGS